jgi:hypothetical protein
MLRPAVITEIGGSILAWDNSIIDSSIQNKPTPYWPKLFKHKLRLTAKLNCASNSKQNQTERLLLLQCIKRILSLDCLFQCTWWQFGHLVGFCIERITRQLLRRRLWQPPILDVPRERGGAVVLRGPGVCRTLRPMELCFIRSSPVLDLGWSDVYSS